MPLLQPIPAPTVVEGYERDLGSMKGIHKKTFREFHILIDTLGVPDIANGAGMEAAQWSGCRIFTDYDSTPPLSCDMLIAGGQLRSVSDGPQAAEMMLRFREIQKLDEVKRNSYELRVLSVPGLLVEAFRLRSLTPGEPDLVVPILAMDPRLAPGTPYPADDFLAILREEAQEHQTRQASYDDPLGI